MARQNKEKSVTVDSHVEHAFAMRRLLNELEPSAEERIGELSLVLAHVLLNMNDKLQVFTVSGHFDYIHQLEEGEVLPPDGPNYKRMPMLTEDRRVDDMEFSRAYLLQPGNPFSKVAFVTQEGDHYVFSDSNIIGINISQETLLNKFEQIDQAIPLT